MDTHARRIVAFLRALVRLVPIALCASHHSACRAGLKPAGGRGSTIESLKVCRSNLTSVLITERR